MSEVWNKVYNADSELGGGHGIGTTFFSSNNIEVKASDYSVITDRLSSIAIG